MVIKHCEYKKHNDILKHNGVIFKNAPRPSVETISGLTQIKYTYIQALLEAEQS